MRDRQYFALIVKDGDTVTGVLRFGDLFEVVRERLAKCDLAQQGG